MNYLTYAGKSCREFGVIISGGRSYGSGEKDYETISIPGRSGDLLLDNGRFKNVTVEYDAYIPRNFNERYAAFESWLMGQSGYQVLEDAYQPDIYRMGTFTVGLQSEPVIRLDTGSFTISFNCKPQKFLKSGDTPIKLTGAGTLYNPTLFTAKPMIRCYGTSGTITVGDISVTVTGCSSYVDIDCELMEAYEGSTSRNSTTTLTDGEFPTLPAGENAVSFTGFSIVEITPRWWRV